MKIVKRATALILCFCLILLCCACGGKEETPEYNSEPSTENTEITEELEELKEKFLDKSLYYPITKMLAKTQILFYLKHISFNRVFEFCNISLE